MLRDYIVTVLSAPLSDLEVTRVFSDRASGELLKALDEWLTNIKQINPTLEYSSTPASGLDAWLVLAIQSPHEGVVAFRVVKEPELADQNILSGILDEAEVFSADLTVAVLCVDQTNPAVAKHIELQWVQADQVGSRLLIMEPAWAAAGLIERMRPFVFAGIRNPGEHPATAHFEVSQEPLAAPVVLRRSRSQLRSLLGDVVEDPGTYYQRVREVQREEMFPGTVLLCTTFLPPVTHSESAVVRFYRGYGSTAATLELIRRKAEWERETWIKHIRNYQRIDIIDRGQLEEFFAAPEYYQMPLTESELQEQVENIGKLLDYENYTLCLTPEAVALAFEIRGEEVRIRSDRRNKGQPRVGRVNTLILRDRRVADMFEREFWSLFRTTEAEFKDKAAVRSFLQQLVSMYHGPSVTATHKPNEYDVFLCHNNLDKSEVKRIGNALKEHGLRPWLDEWNLIPGRPWQRVLEAEIERIKSCAVFVGPNSVGPWHNLELEAFIREFVSRDCPVIPVILPTTTTTPELPVFLKGMHWVDFRTTEPDPVGQLIWGITGRRQDTT